MSVRSNVLSLGGRAAVETSSASLAEVKLSNHQLPTRRMSDLSSAARDEGAASGICLPATESSLSQEGNFRDFGARRVHVLSKAQLPKVLVGPGVTSPKSRPPGCRVCLLYTSP